MINLHNLKKFDLSLLVIFECIYQHLSISKAAESLYITPFAVSQSLRCLRAQSSDPLFTRSGKGIAPTAVGLNLCHYLEKNFRGLEQAANTVSKSGLKKNFIIYGPQLISCTNSSMLIRCLRQDTSIDTECHGILFSTEDAEELLAQRRTDLAVTLQPIISRLVTCMLLYAIHNSLVCSNKYPRITDTSNYKQIIAGELTLLISKSVGADEVQMDINERPVNHGVSFRSPSLMTMINSTSVTDLLGIAPTKLYDLHRSFSKLRETKLEQPPPAVKFYISYNKASLNNPVFFQFVDRLNDSF